MAKGAQMLNVRRRVEALERSRSLQRGPDRYDEIQRRAIQHLSTEDLRLLRDLIAQGRTQGELTDQECAATEAFTSVFEQEVRAAGYSSLSQFQRSCSSGR